MASSMSINHHAGTPKHNNYKRHDKREDTAQFVAMGLRSDGCQWRKSTSFYRYRSDIREFRKPFPELIFPSHLLECGGACSM